MAPTQEQLLAEAFESYRDEIRAFLRRRLGDVDDAEDLTQEAFLRAQRSGNVDRLENPRAYLFRIAENLARDLLRRRRLGVFDHSREVDTSEVAYPAPSPEDRAQARQELAALSRAVAGLSPRVRQALILHKFCHLSYNQVATVLGISPKTVEKHLAKGIALCRAALHRGDDSAATVVEFEPQRARAGRRG